MLRHRPIQRNIGAIWRIDVKKLLGYVSNERHLVNSAHSVVVILQLLESSRAEYAHASLIFAVLYTLSVHF